MGIADGFGTAFPEDSIHGNNRGEVVEVIRGTMAMCGKPAIMLDMLEYLF